MASPGNPAYKDAWIRCTTCGTRRRTFLLLAKHYREHPECRPCNCGGVVFRDGLTAHRPGTRYCKMHPHGDIERAVRDGDHEAAILLPGVRGGDVPPF